MQRSFIIAHSSNVLGGLCKCTNPQQSPCPSRNSPGPQATAGRGSPARPGSVAQVPTLAKNGETLGRKATRDGLEQAPALNICGTHPSDGRAIPLLTPRAAPASSSHPPQPQHHKPQTRSQSQPQDKPPSCKKLVQVLSRYGALCLSTSPAQPLLDTAGVPPWLAAPLPPRRPAAAPAQVREPEELPPEPVRLQDHQWCRKRGGTLHLLR